MFVKNNANLNSLNWNDVTCMFSRVFEILHSNYDFQLTGKLWVSVLEVKRLSIRILSLNYK